MQNNEIMYTCSLTQKNLQSTQNVRKHKRKVQVHTTHIIHNNISTIQNRIEEKIMPYVETSLS